MWMSQNTVLLRVRMGYRLNLSTNRVQYIKKVEEHLSVTCLILSLSLPGVITVSRPATFRPCASRMPANCCSRSCSPWTSSPDSNCLVTTSDQGRDRSTACARERFGVRGSTWSEIKGFFLLAETDPTFNFFVNLNNVKFVCFWFVFFLNVYIINQKILFCNYLLCSYVHYILYIVVTWAFIIKHVYVYLFLF